MLSLTRIGDPPGKLPLYRANELHDDAVWIVEGEKCANAMRSIELPATTSSHGAKAANRSDWSALAGLSVNIVPDRNDAGRAYATDVARIVTRLHPPARVKIIEASWIPDGGDIADVIEAVSENQDCADIARDLEQLAKRTPYWTSTANASLDGAAVVSRQRCKPFPLECLPEPVRSYVADGSRAIGCDPTMIALPMLAVCGAVIGTTRRIRLKYSWREYSIVWAVVVLRSGKLKSPAYDLAVKPLQRLQSDRLREYVKALE